MVSPEVWMVVWKTGCKMSRHQSLASNQMTNASSWSTSAVKVWRKRFCLLDFAHVAHDSLELCCALRLLLIEQGDSVLELARVVPSHPSHYAVTCHGDGIFHSFI